MLRLPVRYSQTGSSNDEDIFTLYVTGIGFYIGEKGLKPNAIQLLSRLKSQILEAGYQVVNVVYYDTFNGGENEFGYKNVDVDVAKKVLESIQVAGKETVHVQPDYLTYDDLLGLQDQDSFLLLDLAHITRFRMASDADHAGYKARVAIVPYGSSATGKYLNINAIYPSFLEEGDAMVDIIGNFHFIRFHEKKLVTYIWCVLDKRLRLSLDNFQIDYFAKEGPYKGYVDVQMKSSRVVKAIDQLVWAQVDAV